MERHPVGGPRNRVVRVAVGVLWPLRRRFAGHRGPTLTFSDGGHCGWLLRRCPALLCDARVVLGFKPDNMDVLVVQAKGGGGMDEVVAVLKEDQVSTSRWSYCCCQPHRRYARGGCVGARYAARCGWFTLSGHTPQRLPGLLLTPVP